MRVSFRPLIALLLAIVLTLTGQSMAVARGMPGPSGTMVLCTGTGPITVLTDAQGQPVGKAHICPDCTLSLFAVGVMSAPDLQRPAEVSLVRFVWPHVTGQSRVQLQPQARGPPVLF